MAGKKRGRLNGEGSVYQRASDDKWVGALTLADGKRKVFYGADADEVRRKLAKAVSDRDRGLPAARDERQTLAAYLTSWLAMVKSQVRDSGYISYEKRVRLYITPRLGRVKLAQLGPQHIKELYAWMLAERKLSPTTVNHTAGVLHYALKDAVRMGVVARNVCDLVDPPRKAKRKMQILTPVHVSQLLEAARGDTYSAILTVAVTTGARLGELLALRSSLVDLDRGSMTIRTGRAEVVGGFADTEPKTDAANRTISLTTQAIAALREHRAATLEQRMWLGEAWQGGKDGYVFPNQVGGQLQHSTVERAFTKLVKRADLPIIRFHDLRHTAASLMLNAGVEVTEVARILGHSSPHITYKIYAHCIPGAQREAVAAMESILSSCEA